MIDRRNYRILNMYNLDATFGVKKKSEPDIDIDPKYAIIADEIAKIIADELIKKLMKREATFKNDKSGSTYTVSFSKTDMDLTDIIRRVAPLDIAIPDDFKEYIGKRMLELLEYEIFKLAGIGCQLEITIKTKPNGFIANKLTYAGSIHVHIAPTI